MHWVLFSVCTHAFEVPYKELFSILCITQAYQSLATLGERSLYAAPQAANIQEEAVVRAFYTPCQYLYSDQGKAFANFPEPF